MRTLFFLPLFLFGIVAFAQNKSSFVKDLPQPVPVVNDFGNFFTLTEKEYFEKELVSYRQKTGNAAIVIITLPTLTDSKTGTQFTVEEAARLYFNKWGIGNPGKNNGVLILLSLTPRRARIATGKGIASVLTDNICQNIIDQKLVPFFNAGLYADGLKEAIGAIETTLGEKAVQAKSK